MGCPLPWSEWAGAGASVGLGSEISPVGTTIDSTGWDSDIGPQREAWLRRSSVEER